MFLPLSLLLTPSYSRLVLDSWDDLYREDGEVDVERLMREADLLTVTTKPYQDCPEVDMDVYEYEVFLMVDGLEVRDTLEKENVRDIWNTTRTISSLTEPWIKGAIELR